jgi:hypothetical protein
VAPFVLDLKAEPLRLPRYRVTNEFAQATQDDVDAAIAAVADADGGQTNRQRIREWSRPWLRAVRTKDTSAATLEARFRESAHAGRHRPDGGHHPRE